MGDHVGRFYTPHGGCYDRNTTLCYDAVPGCRYDERSGSNVPNDLYQPVWCAFTGEGQSPDNLPLSTRMKPRYSPQELLDSGNEFLSGINSVRQAMSARPRTMHNMEDVDFNYGRLYSPGGPQTDLMTGLRYFEDSTSWYHRRTGLNTLMEGSGVWSAFFDFHKNCLGFAPFGLYPPSVLEQRVPVEVLNTSLECSRQARHLKVAKGSVSGMGGIAGTGMDFQGTGSLIPGFQPYVPGSLSLPAHGLSAGDDEFFGRPAIPGQVQQPMATAAAMPSFGLSGMTPAQAQALQNQFVNDGYSGPFDMSRLGSGYPRGPEMQAPLHTPTPENASTSEARFLMMARFAKEDSVLPASCQSEYDHRMAELILELSVCYLSCPVTRSRNRMQRPAKALYAIATNMLEGVDGTLPANEVCRPRMRAINTNPEVYMDTLRDVADWLAKGHPSFYYPQAKLDHLVDILNEEANLVRDRDRSRTTSSQPLAQMAAQTPVVLPNNTGPAGRNDGDMSTGTTHTTTTTVRYVTVAQRYDAANLFLRDLGSLGLPIETKTAERHAYAIRAGLRDGWVLWRLGQERTAMNEQTGAAPTYQQGQTLVERQLPHNSKAKRSVSFADPVHEVPPYQHDHSSVQPRNGQSTSTTTTQDLDDLSTSDTFNSSESTKKIATTGATLRRTPSLDAFLEAHRNSSREARKKRAETRKFVTDFFAKMNATTGSTKRTESTIPVKTEAQESTVDGKLASDNQYDLSPKHAKPKTQETQGKHPTDADVLARCEDATEDSDVNTDAAVADESLRTADSPQSVDFEQLTPPAGSVKEI